MKAIKIWGAMALGIFFGAISQQAAAQGSDDSADADSPLRHGSYVSPLATYVKSDSKSGLDDGIGGRFIIGYRSDYYAIEAGGVYTSLGSASDEGAVINGLLFPFRALPGLYGTIGVGALEYKDYPSPTTTYKYTQLKTFDAGGGYLFPLRIGDYEFGVRGEVRYRIGKRERRQNDSNVDYDITRHADDIVFNLGLQLPLKKLPLKAAPAPAPVEVVKPVDSDGDGVTDDLDKCPGTPTDTKVDEKGCPLPPPCKTPEPGQKIDLSGCATGDVIVLRGVNFEFDKSRLTVNAKTLLDDVASALLAQPALHVEIGGYTDSKGSDAYNQKLSEQRALSVMNYLIEKGVAPDHLTSLGYGESQPVADNETDEGRELNRHVELKVLNRDEAAAPATNETPSAPETSPAPAADDAPASPSDVRESRPTSDRESVGVPGAMPTPDLPTPAAYAK